MVAEANVFEDDYRPTQLFHRDTEQEQLARAFEPALNDSLPRGTLQGIAEDAGANGLESFCKWIESNL